MPGLPDTALGQHGQLHPVLEKALPFGRRAARVIGALMIAAGLGVLVLG
jgi:hypothetical protein